ncbi:MAG: hypothetical protein AB7V27_17360 [Candidatus Binatia bacterium]
MRAAIALLLLAAGVSCGGGFLIIVNTGTVIADADCREDGGSFELRERGGLTVLVILTDETTVVFARGGGASCTDLIANTAVAVRGREADGVVTAESIRID